MKEKPHVLISTQAQKLTDQRSACLCLRNTETKNIAVIIKKKFLGHSCLHSQLETGLSYVRANFKNKITQQNKHHKTKEKKTKTDPEVPVPLCRERWNFYLVCFFS